MVLPVGYFTAMLSSWTSALSLLAVARSGTSGLDLDVSLPRIFPRASSCPISGQVSCHNTTTQGDLCCFESPGGLLLQTQFWDTSGPGVNLPSSWTVHGLWPDNCDGTFTQNCDPSRDYTDIASIIQNAGQTELLSFMNTFWLNINGQNEQFWEHEWSTHGTCYSTLQLQCIPSGSPRGTDAVDFFLTVEKLFKSLPTFDWLSQGGITPSSSRTFTLSEITSALKSASGVTPALDCQGTAINQISWYFNLKGSIIDGTFIPIDAPKKGSCATSGLTYPPKSGSGGGTSTSTSPGGSPTGAPGSVPVKSTLTALMSNGGIQGGVLTSGTWSAQTPATFTATSSGSGFTLSTQKGSCGVSGGQFQCGSSVTASTFGSATSGSNLFLTFDNSSAFSADSVPSGTTQVPIFTGSSKSQVFSLAFNAA
ncbi:ribonuclease T2 [Gautieria morchelliformis]|nr:ribonuclease T2 [Gautieria morchelliformis]